MGKQLVICLDPGHGQNTNKSPNNPNYVEGTQMWKLGQKLQKALESYGFEVINTRPNISDDPSLSARGKVAGETGSSLLLSLHSNATSASPDGTYDLSVNGVCACYSQKDKAFNQPLAKKLAETVGNLMGNGVKAVFYNDYPGKPGTDYFGVLRYSAAYGCPHAIIIEHGYHTNVYESNWLLDDANLDRLALEEARVICDYFGVDKKFDENTLINGVKAGYIARVIDAEGDVFIPNKQEAIIAIAQCMKDMYENGSFGKTLQEVLNNNFIEPHKTYHQECLQAVEDVFINGVVRNSNWKILQYRPFSKYANKDGTFNKELCKDLIEKYKYLGKDGISATWGHFYFGEDISVVGDVNNDRVVTVSDITVLLDQLSKNSFTDGSDVNRDGVVNISDVTALLDILSNQKKDNVMVELKVLKKADIDYQVKTIQRILTQIGYRDQDGKYLQVDGNFGSKTEYAVKNFQKDNGLTVDGKVGKNTWDKLLKG